MKRLSRYHILPAVALILFGAVLGVQIDSYLSDDDALKQFEKIKRAFVLINGRYVDSVDAGEVAEEGVKGMLNGLDPHSSYISAEDARDVQDQYEGSFGGVGILFEVVNDTARVISPVADGPSEKVGVMAGDRIVAIEGDPAAGSQIDLTSNDIQDRLKGEIGTEVSMTVYRPVSDKRITFTITRDEIPLHSINSAYMVDDQTGYIKIDRFAMTTHDEFLEELKTLRDQGMDRLLLDLRSNPGGVMKSAVQIADEMLGGGMTIVKTKGRSSDMDYQHRASSGDALEQEPVIVLVNRQSASASEIISGALQDHDRALIVGERTFGKALVQKQFELNDGSLMQMTVGRYYTPVGRLIQTPYEQGNMQSYAENKFAHYEGGVFNVSEYKNSIPDSLTYQTDHGRKVFGGGGILPDYIVQPDTSTFDYFVRTSGLDFAFATKWFSEHEKELRGSWQNREEDFRESYEVSDEVLAAFWDFAKEEGVTFTQNAEEANSKEQIFTQSVAEENEDLIANRIKGFLAQRLYGSGTARRILNQTDPYVQEALSLWPSSQELASHHAPSTFQQQ